MKVEKEPDPRTEAEALARVRKLTTNAQQWSLRNGLAVEGRELVAAVEAAAVEFVRRVFDTSRFVVVRQLTAEQIAGPVYCGDGRVFTQLAPASAGRSGPEGEDA